MCIEDIRRILSYHRNHVRCDLKVPFTFRVLFIQKADICEPSEQEQVSVCLLLARTFQYFQTFFEIVFALIVVLF